MPKRKRSVEEEAEERFSNFRQDLFKALKAAKGLERQRQTKRLRDSKSTPEKTQRLQKEVVVLKSLDLHQAAHAHLCSALLRIKAVSESPDLPAEIKAGVPKPDISEEEKAALHNVTSALCNRKEVRDILAKAVPGICDALGVAPPDKKGKGKKGTSDGRRDKEEQPADRDTAGVKPSEKQDTQSPEPSLGAAVSDEEEDEAIDRFAAMLGGSSSDEGSGSDSGEDEEEEDPMAITSDEEDGDVDMDADEDEWAGFEDSDEASDEGLKPGKISDRISSGAIDSSDEDSSEDEEDTSLAPPPKRAAKPKSTKQPTMTGNSTFLPSLMGGYISGSESASDVDVAPPRKNRRGQRERQAIWEKRYKDKAKHLSKQQQSKGGVTWDPRRGAVEEGSKPWKRGIKSPFAKQAAAGAGAPPHSVRPQGANSEPLRPRAKTKPQDTGPLHPSWEARKKAKEKQETAVFQGKKITFD